MPLQPREAVRSASALSKKLRYPIVLVHGLGARGQYGPFDYFYGLPKYLREQGNTVLVPNLTSWARIETRARQLREQIEKSVPKPGKVNLVCHSLGGLDARFLASQLDDSRIASITTIGTPHRGTVMGDIADGLVPGLAFSAADRFLKILGMRVSVVKQLSQRYCTEVFNRQIPDSRRVAYFSATTAIANPIVRHSLPLFWVSHPVVNRYEGDNDGFVSVESAKWGEHIATARGDHYAQIGYFVGSFPRGMDYYRFYDRIVQRLRKEGY